MKTMTWTLFTTSGFATLLALAFGYVAISRSQLPYNEQGRYLDRETSVVYQESALEAYVAIAVVCLFTGIALFVGAKKFKLRPQ